MRSDDLYLVDIIEAADSIAGMIAGKTAESFATDQVLSSAVQYQLMVAGEACSKLEEATLEFMPNAPIAQIRGFRNRIVHGYFAVDLEIVWEVASQHVPELASDAGTALKRLFPTVFSQLQERRGRAET